MHKCLLNYGWSPMHDVHREDNFKTILVPKSLRSKPRFMLGYEDGCLKGMVWGFRKVWYKSLELVPLSQDLDDLHLNDASASLEYLALVISLQPIICMSIQVSQEIKEFEKRLRRDFKRVTDTYKSLTCLEILVCKSVSEW